ncbi:GuaB1 family IMP dehydrogenase-related protein [Polyangium jinanense]|uniref:GMP reductase n=1 Tax=Polyangium jinanense TaxID=2829994 RepID=A0A9X4ART9_9BACT|nr:GuaB1 family IMP dehydrogenase-related protein [Polyangium jinanense]MDC3954198.1 GuaB1 family IMP dehydrogenase-related protein [Polyangium jinanense]MDC3981846.1 GuaB1 family IMP dehydrogenase-related protein [Polyangium jinanense]
MRFLHPERDENLELALEDVFLTPGYFEGVSRLDVDLRPVDFPGGSHPIVSANMNAVTGKRMAETMARFGGLGVLPQDMALDTTERIVRHIKSADPRYDTPLAVSPRESLRDVQGIIRKRSHDMVVVVDDERRPLGIVTHADLRDRDQYTPASALMSSRLVTIPAGTPNRDAFLLMEEARVKAVPALDAEGKLVGVLTRDDAVRLELLRPSLSANGELMVAAAVGISANAPEFARRLVDIGVSAIVLDTAHGHQRRMIEAIRAVRKAIGTAVPLVAGNVCTAEGTRDLLEAGADIVKVNVGPGAMCTTRMQTGAGRPTFSSVLACAREAHAHGKQVWADGGVKYPRDVALYLAAGASRVMVGTALAGTYESPGDVKEDREGALYKENYGMASARAVHDRTADIDPFERAKKGFFREGISTSRIYIQEGKESVGALLVDMITGVQSACTYAGARSLPELHEKAVIGVQTLAGYGEGKPHGAVRR